ncbi:unnamed protein product, partial [Gadus morhua 'NCC']
LCIKPEFEEQAAKKALSTVIKAHADTKRFFDSLGGTGRTVVSGPLGSHLRVPRHGWARRTQGTAAAGWAGRHGKLSGESHW